MFNAIKELFWIFAIAGLLFYIAYLGMTSAYAIELVEYDEYQQCVMRLGEVECNK